MKYLMLIISCLFIALVDEAKEGKEDLVMLIGIIFLNSSLILFSLKEDK